MTRRSGLTLPTHPFDDDKLHEECGIFGVYGHEDASAHAALGLHALQHRGQEAAGITSFDGDEFHSHKSMGLVGDHFSSREVVDLLKGFSAIGHVRYSTTGGTSLRNIQPLFAELSSGGFAIAHNGNITNALHLRKQLVSRGSIFQSTSDTEVIIHLLATSTFPTLLDRLIDALRQVEGAYSFVALTPEGMIGMRDPLGVRPLVLGRLEDGAYILSSETCALDIIGARFLRNVEPGEIVTITDKGLESMKPFPEAAPKPCIFEHVYFSRPDSLVDGMNVYEVRKRIGAELAREVHTEADVVVPVPDSGVPAAIGFAQASGIPFELGIIRNHYVGRTFIEPADHIRHLGVKLKHNANRGQLAGKRVVLVDDSIVRGTTSVKLVNMVRQAGASEVHMRVASPPTAFSCFYGVDTPQRDKLLAANMEVEEMRKHIDVDSLAFVSIDGLYRAVNQEARDTSCPQFCDACFTGEYPTHLTDQEDGEYHSQLSLVALKKKQA
ncbi:MAG: amidophosphoribosyltransferase [Sphingomonadales bacterium]